MSNINMTAGLKKRTKFTFAEIGISPGDILYFLDNPHITCKVIPDDKVEYNGETWSLSGLSAYLISLKTGKNVSVRGPEYWGCLKENLVQRRMRME